MRWAPVLLEDKRICQTETHIRTRCGRNQQSATKELTKSI